MTITRVLPDCLYFQWGETRVWLRPWSIKIQRESIVGPITVWPKQ